VPISFYFGSQSRLQSAVQEQSVFDPPQKAQRLKPVILLVILGTTGSRALTRIFE